MTLRHKILFLSAVVVVAAVTVLTAYDAFSPKGTDFMVIDVRIEDAPYGGDHLMAVQRDIYRAFQARWFVTVSNERGQLLCTANGGPVTFTPGRPMPSRVTLFGWWMNADGHPERVCSIAPLPPDCYSADTLWSVPLSEDRALLIRAVSNRFCVRKAR